MDDWVVFGSRLDQKSQFGFDDFFLRRHNEHLIGGLVLWNVGLGAVFGLKSYTPWVISVVIANILVVWVVRKYMTRLGVNPLLAAITSPIFLLLSPVGTLSYWSFDQVFIFTLALNLIHFGMTSHSAKEIAARDLFGALLSCVGVFIFSVSVITIPVIAFVQIWHRRWLRAFVASTPLALYVAWTFTYKNRLPSTRWLDGTSRGVNPLDDRDLALFFSFGWKLISRTVWPNSNPVVFVLVLLILGVGVWYLRLDSSGPRSAAFAAITVAVVYVGGFTWSRGVFTDRIMRVDPPDRYVAVLALLLLPICLLGIQEFTKSLSRGRENLSSSVVRTIALTSIALFTALTLHQRFDQDERISGFALGSKARVFEVANDPNIGTFPADQFVFGSAWPTDLTFGDIVRLKRVGWL
ncbi:MAG: hypothetical protein EBX92_08885 [Actinobacteria bacterium]|nr:hypothetical protein [Actinomycetota bacterium]